VFCVKHNRQFRFRHFFQAFSGNHFYNRTKRKRDSSNADRIGSVDNGFLQRPPPDVSLRNGNGDADRLAGQEKPTPWNPTGLPYSEGAIG
jgi:hypothetical protein